MRTDAHRQLDQKAGGQGIQVMFKGRDMELKEESLVKLDIVEHSEEYCVKNKKEAPVENMEESLVMQNEEAITDQKEGYLIKKNEEQIVEETLSKTPHPGQISKLVKTSSCVEESEGEGSREEQISRLRVAIVAAMGKVGEKAGDTSMGKVGEKVGEKAGDTVMGKVGEEAMAMGEDREKPWDLTWHGMEWYGMAASRDQRLHGRQVIGMIELCNSWGLTSEEISQDF